MAFRVYPNVIVRTYSDLPEATLQFASCVAMLMFWTFSLPADVKPALNQTEIVRSLQYRPAGQFGTVTQSLRHETTVASYDALTSDSL